MLQLSLNFLGKQIARIKPTAPPLSEHNQPLLWKHGITVHMVRPPRARRYLLRLQSDGSARLAIPKRGSQAEGLRFLERSELWLLKQVVLWRNRQSARLPWGEGTRFLFRGEEVVLRLEPTGDHLLLRFADQSIRLSQSQTDYRDTVRSHQRKLAEQELPPRTRELADHHRITISRVTVRAQKTRWGSCSAQGTISLNWRLIQAPPHVVDYLIIHELMHRREMNHSSRYWKHVAEACPDYQTSERWLKQNRLEMA